MKKFLRTYVSITAAALAASPLLQAQAGPKPTPEMQAIIDKDNGRHFGDSPADPGPLATDLSPAMNPKAVNAAIRKVADWQLARAEPYFDRIWTWSVLYSGFLAASDATGEPRYRDAMITMSNRFNWSLRSPMSNADDQSIGQTYVDLYLASDKADPTHLAPTRTALDSVIGLNTLTATDTRIPWWWCDALFMAPPVLVRLAGITHDPEYLTTLDREWAVTKDLLWDKQEHLYLRDARFLDLKTQHETNGKPIFWSRGNGWVVGGLVDILEALPAENSRRAAYQQQFQQMMTRIAPLQPTDGLWRAGLLHADAYRMPEVSGSAFFAYGLAYGLRTGLLDEATFRPVLERCWSAMVAHIYQSGRLGNIQPIGFAPDTFQPSSSYVYGVGAFLLAGSEIDKLLDQKPVSSKKHTRSVK